MGSVLWPGGLPGGVGLVTLPLDFSQYRRDSLGAHVPSTRCLLLTVEQDKNGFYRIGRQPHHRPGSIEDVWPSPRAGRVDGRAGHDITWGRVTPFERRKAL